MADPKTLAPSTMVARRYRIEKTLGKGGMGAVYLAEDLENHIPVALKTLREDLYEREDLVRRFEREARAAARIGHPNIVEVYAVGHDDRLRTRFIVQEYLRGTDVAGCLNELGSLSPLSAMAIAQPVMEALVAAHEAGIVHRDIKPENVFLNETEDGRVVPKVIDFGIAKVTEELDHIQRTQTGMVFGTPWYMSPEQARGDTSIDARTDVWSVGAMIYEMLCGTLPFGGNNPNAVMAQIIFGRPTPLHQHWADVPADLQDVIHRAIESDRDKRFQSMTEFRDAMLKCSFWDGVTPEIAQQFIPKPSSFEGIGDLLPPEFRDAQSTADEPKPSVARRTPPARLRNPSEIIEPAPQPSDEVCVQPPAAPPELELPAPTARIARVNPRLARNGDSEAVTQVPTKASALRPATPPAVTAAPAEAEIGTELPLSLPPARRSPEPDEALVAPRPRRAFKSLQDASAPPMRVSAVVVAISLVCGALLAFGAMRWVRRGDASAQRPPAAARALEAATPPPTPIRVEQAARSGEPEGPRSIPDVRHPPTPAPR